MSDLVNLAREVADGKVSAGAPLLDLLIDARDTRVDALRDLLAHLVNRSDDLVLRFSERPRHMRSDVWEKRISHERLALWVGFREEFANLFWSELLDGGAAGGLRQVESVLDTVKQEEARVSVRDDGDDESSDEDGPQDSGLFSRYGARLKSRSRSW